MQKRDEIKNLEKSNNIFVIHHYKVITEGDFCAVTTYCGAPVEKNRKVLNYFEYCTKCAELSRKV